MLPLLFALSATAEAPPDAGRLVLSPDTGARAVALPRAKPRTQVIAVYGSEADLAAQVNGVRARWLDEAEAQSIGGGTWFVLLHLERDDVAVWLTDTGQGFRLELAPSVEAPLADGQVPGTIADLLSGEIPRVPLPTRPRLLEPLRGDARGLVSDLERLPIDTPTWPDATLAALPEGLRRPLVPAALDEIGLLRLANTGETPLIRSAASFRHAEVLLATGRPADALDHLDRAVRAGGELPHAALHLTWARAALAAGRTADAGEECQTAWVGGAPLPYVLPCFGAVSALTGAPAPTPLARAILASTTEPHARLLAAELLLRDNRDAEARAALDRLHADIQAGHSQFDVHRVDQVRGDAAWGAGDFDAAKRAWDTVPQMSSALVIRETIREILDTPVFLWDRHREDIERFTRVDPTAGPGDRRAAAEAHWILAQISSWRGERGETVRHLNTLLDRYPEESRGAPVLERLAETCMFQIDLDDRRNQRMEMIGFWYECARPELESAIQDTRPIERVSQRLSELSLHRSAREALQVVHRVQARLGEERGETLLLLARLMAREGLLKEAGRTVEYARNAWIAAPEADFAYTEAIVAAEAGDLELALQRGRAAAGDPAFAERVGALIPRWLVDTGRCAEALPLLAAREDPVSKLDRARCAVTLDRCEDGYALTEGLVGAGASPIIAETATWLRGAAGSCAGKPADALGVTFFETLANQRAEHRRVREVIGG